MIEQLKDLRVRLALGGLAVAAIVALGVVPMVAAASPSPAASPSTTAPLSPAASPTPSAAAPGARGGAVPGIRAAILRGAVRADVTVVKRDGSTVIVHYERGQVTAITPTSITIQGRDGKGATFIVTGTTRVRAKGAAIAYSDLKVGDRAMVFGTASGGSYTAVLIRCVQAASS